MQTVYWWDLARWYPATFWTLAIGITSTVSATVYLATWKVFESRIAGWKEEVDRLKYESDSLRRDRDEARAQITTVPKAIPDLTNSELRELALNLAQQIEGLEHLSISGAIFGSNNAAADRTSDEEMRRLQQEHVGDIDRLIADRRARLWRLQPQLVEVRDELKKRVVKSTLRQREEYVDRVYETLEGGHSPMRVLVNDLQALAGGVLG